MFLVDPDGGAPQKIVDAPGGLPPYPGCTPDGKWLVYTAVGNLMKISTAGGTPSVLVQRAHEGRVSPDGALIAAHKVDDGREQLALFSMADGALVRILPGAATGGFQWLPS